MPYTLILVIFCCAVFYYQVGESEYGNGGLLSLVSVKAMGSRLNY